MWDNRSNTRRTRFIAKRCGQAIMDNVTLANRENQLYSIVLDGHGTMEEKAKQLRDKGVYENYKQIHLSYAENSDKNLESLKRGLFIQWLLDDRTSMLYWD